MPSSPHPFYGKQGISPCRERTHFRISKYLSIMGYSITRRFVTATANASITAKEIESSALVMDIGEIVKANTNTEKFVFNRDLALEKALDAFKGAVIRYWVELNPKTGKPMQKAQIVKADGNTMQARIYGSDKELIEGEKPLSDCQIGFCKAGEDIVADAQNTASGLRRIPRIYVNIAEKRA